MRHIVRIGKYSIADRMTGTRRPLRNGLKANALIRSASRATWSKPSAGTRRISINALFFNNI
jgi:hypothetical protein